MRICFSPKRPNHGRGRGALRAPPPHRPQRHEADRGLPSKTGPGGHGAHGVPFNVDIKHCHDSHDGLFDVHTTILNCLLPKTFFDIVSCSHCTNIFLS